MALGEFGPPFLDGRRRSVNRKVQGSNPWSGAKSKFESDVGGGLPRARTSFVHPLYIQCDPRQSLSHSGEVRRRQVVRVHRGPPKFDGS